MWYCTHYSKNVPCKIRLCLLAVFLWIPWPLIPVITIGSQVRNLFKGINSERMCCEQSAIFPTKSCIYLSIFGPAFFEVIEAARRRPIGQELGSWSKQISYIFMFTSIHHCFYMSSHKFQFFAIKSLQSFSKIPTCHQNLWAISAVILNCS